ncbi:MAG: NAD(P)H-dependent oxidoreductase [Bacteroidetes bacterium]|nr:NAD(P)H-dependent oxidoreductase [Bacteroidota bacterium]
MNLIEKLNWRYAVKRYTNAKVPTNKLNRILEAIRLSASSAGLQPYSILVIENEELKKQLLAAANNQPQVTEASHLLVFATWENITEEKVNNYIQHVATVRDMALESLDVYKNRLLGLTARNAEENFNWAARQTYIAMGTGLVAAADEQVDATPMEGFDSVGFDDILKLKEKGLKSVAIMTLGYRDIVNDPTVNFKKVRRSGEDLFIHFKN